MATTNPVRFFKEVRSEAFKITWPTRRETLVTTVMVVLLSALTATFFAIVDILIRSGLQGVLAFFGS